MLAKSVLGGLHHEYSLAFSLPLMQVDGLSLGLQSIGAGGCDGALVLCARAHWLMRNVGASPPPAVAKISRRRLPSLV